MTSDGADPELAKVVRRELLLLSPAVRRSREASSALLDPEFREFGSSGTVWDLASILTMMGDEDLPPPRMEDVVGVRLAPDVILLTYRTRRPARTTIRSSIWRLRDGEWLLYFHQGTVQPP